MTLNFFSGLIDTLWLRQAKKKEFEKKKHGQNRI